MTRGRRAAVVAGVAVAAASVAAALVVSPDVPAAALDARYADRSSRFVPVAGLRVHVRDEGQGPPVVLIHGTSASLHTWDAWAAALRDSFRVVRFDLPAFGLTGTRPDGDYGVPAYVRFVEAVLDSLRVGPAVVAGNSLGGEIAWHLAAAAPSRVARLVLVDPAGIPFDRTPPLAWRIARTPGAARVVEYVSPRSLIRSSLLEVYADDAMVTDTLVDRYWLMARRPGARAAFVARVRASAVGDTAALRRLTMPTLVLWGDGDRWIPMSLASEFGRRIPGSRVVVVPHAGHVPHDERPAETLEALRGFLRDTRWP